MFTVVCPRCKAKGEADDHTKAIIEMKHNPQCGYMHGLATTFNVEEVAGDTPKEEPPKVEAPPEPPKVETPPEETQPVEMTSGDTTEQK